MRWLQHARLFHVIDWLLQLSDDLSTWFWQELERWEGQQRMPYVTSVERIGIEKGIAKGQTALVLHQLHRKLGDVPEAMQNRILALSSDAILDVSTALFDFTTLDDVTRWLDADGGDPIASVRANLILDGLDRLPHERSLKQTHARKHAAGIDSNDLWEDGNDAKITPIGP